MKKAKCKILIGNFISVKHLCFPRESLSFAAVQLGRTRGDKQEYHWCGPFIKTSSTSSD